MKHRLKYGDDDVVLLLEDGHVLSYNHILTEIQRERREATVNKLLFVCRRLLPVSDCGCDGNQLRVL